MNAGLADTGLGATAGGPQALSERTVQLRGSRVARAALRLAGWRVEFDGLPAAQGLMVVYPHTSNWDFVVGLLAKWAIGMPATFLCKDSLFRVPLFGRWVRWLGGVPVARGAPQGMVGQLASALRTARDEGRFMWLMLAPEGTRARTEGWRTGFYSAALQAGVPVALVGLDYGQQRLSFDSCWRLSGDLAADFAVFAQRLAHCRGHHPSQAAPVRPLSRTNGTST